MPRGYGVAASEGLAAAAFYVALAATVGGAMVLARGVVEKKSGGNRIGFVLLAIGFVGIALSVFAYVSGPRRMLPF